MGDDDEFAERNAFLLVLLGLVSLADEALAPAAGAPVPDAWPPAPRHDDGVLLR